MSLEGIACPNHPNNDAVTRCFGCFKPLCERCAREVEGHDFCSPQCAEGHARTTASLQEFNEQDRKRRRKALIRKLIIMFVLLLVGIGIWQYYESDPEGFMEHIEAAKAFVLSIKETVQGLFSNE